MFGGIICKEPCTVLIRCTKLTHPAHCLLAKTVTKTCRFLNDVALLRTIDRYRDRASPRALTKAILDIRKIKNSKKSPRFGRAHSLTGQGLNLHHTSSSQTSLPSLPFLPPSSLVPCNSTHLICHLSHPKRVLMLYFLIIHSLLENYTYNIIQSSGNDE